jgi:hypothetical protein
MDCMEFFMELLFVARPVAFVPQIVMLHKMRVVENLTSHYVAFLGLYRFFYILNWIYRYQYEDFFCWTQSIAALL